ncbi:MAG: isocitrate lyase/phosphoenolpyruvate mutase family protein [Pseudomonadota bacterium]
MSSTDQPEKATAFKAFHVPGDPLVLTNIWDAGSAQAVTNAGAKALATGSASVAMARGFTDGEDIPLSTLLSVLAEITQATDLPVSADFETGFAEGVDGLVANIEQLIATGVVGINFEDQVIATGALRPIDEQVERISTVRAASQGQDLDLFINARTDVFLKEPDQDRHPGLVGEAKERLAAYTEAGASGAFVPGLSDHDLIADLCETLALPVNVMAMGDEVNRSRLAGLGVARISAGPAPYRRAMAGLEEEARRALAS